MRRFRYDAFTPSGGRISGEMVGDNFAAVIAHLQDLGLLPINAEETAEAGGHRFQFRLFDRRRLSSHDLGVATQELATLLRAGLSLDRALDMLIELSDSPRLRPPLAAVLKLVRGGSSLADALAAQGTAFPSLYVNMIRAGEHGGSLEVTLARLADYLGKSYATRESVKSALVYPIILVFVAGFSLLLVFTVVLPRFQPLFDSAGAHLPVSAAIIMAVGDVVGAYWWIGVVIFLIAVGAFRWAMTLPIFIHWFHRVLLRLPLVRDVIVKMETARFGRTLGTLVANGSTLPTALALSKDTLANRVIAEAVEHVSIRLKEGEGLSTPLAEAKVLPRLATHLMRVGEETGRLDEMLLKVADIYDDEVKRTIERLLAILTPALTLGLGAGVATIIMSILAALLSVNELAM